MAQKTATELDKEQYLIIKYPKTAFCIYHLCNRIGTPHCLDKPIKKFIIHSDSFSLLLSVKNRKIRKPFNHQTLKNSKLHESYQKR